MSSTGTRYRFVTSALRQTMPSAPDTAAPAPVRPLADDKDEEEDDAPPSITYPPTAPLDAPTRAGMAEARAALSSRFSAVPAASTTRSASSSSSLAALATAPSSAWLTNSTFAQPTTNKSAFTSTATAAPAAIATAAASTSASSSASSFPEGPLRVPLLEEEIRLLRQELSSCSSTRASYKSQIYALEKTVLDLREVARDASERLAQREGTLEDWRFRDKQLDAQAAQREQEWTEQMAAREAELVAAKRQIHAQEDALYKERSALASLRSTAAQALQREQRFRAEVEQQLQSQVRNLALERNEAHQRGAELSADLVAATQRAQRLQEEKDALFTKLYASATRLGPDHQPVRECRAPEAALLELQRSEIESLRGRMDLEQQESAARVASLRTELRQALHSNHEQRDKITQLKAALAKCVASMDEQRAASEANATATAEVEKQQQQQQQEKKQSSEDEAQAESGAAALQGQNPPPTEVTPPQQLQEKPLSSEQNPQTFPSPAVSFVPSAASHVAPVLPTVSSAAAASSASSLPASVSAATVAAPVMTAAYAAPHTFHQLTSREALAHTQHLLAQEEAASEARRQRREERRQAWAHDASAAIAAHQPYAAAAATAVPVAASVITANAPEIVVTAHAVPPPTSSAAAATSTLPIVTATPVYDHPLSPKLIISAAPPAAAALPAPTTAAAAPSAPAVADASSSSATQPHGPRVSFDFSFMDTALDSVTLSRPFPRVRLDEQADMHAKERRGVFPSDEHDEESTLKSYEDVHEEQMQRALEQALQAVESDQRQRHVHWSSTSSASSTLRPSSPHEAAARNNGKGLEHAMARLKRLQQQQREIEEDRSSARGADAYGARRPSAARSSARSSSSAPTHSHTAASSARRPISAVSSGTFGKPQPLPPAVVSPSARISHLPRRNSIGGGSAVGSGKENQQSAASAAVYKPSREILAAAGLPREEEEQHNDRSATLGVMAPLNKRIPAPTRVPRLHLPPPPQPRSPPRQQQQRSRPNSRSTASSRSSSATRGSSSVGGGALGQVTASLRGVAASLKKHRRTLA